MINPALTAVEEAFGMTLNPEHDYLAQLGDLAASGELANRVLLNQILFKLCMIIDTQAQEIKALQDDRVAIANKMLELEGKKDATPTETPKLDPTAPLQS